MTMNEQNFSLPELTQNEQPLHIPQRRRHDWSQSVMRKCIHCDQRAPTLHHEGFGGFMCASCFDAEYTADLKAMLVTALERLETAEKRVDVLEESHAQVIQSRDHYKRASEEGLKQLAAENVQVRERHRFIRALAVSILEHSGGRHDWRGAMEDASDLVKTVDEVYSNTPATDRIVAGIKADGVEEFVETCREKSKQAISSDIRDNWWLAGEHADDFAKQLREGADK